jgi:hypothetical protein
MFPMANCHDEAESYSKEEAEFYAREAMIDHIQLQFCANDAMYFRQPSARSRQAGQVPQP